jgi:hypothetical protein
MPVPIDLPDTFTDAQRASLVAAYRYILESARQIRAERAAQAAAGADEAGADATPAPADPPTP